MPDPIRIGVVSDTHGHVRNTTAAIELLRNENVSHLIHCGDIGGAEVIKLLSEWPTWYVFGNNDRQEEHLTSTIQGFGQTCCGKTGELQLGSIRIGFTHGHKPKKMKRLLEDKSIDLVCYGHTHQAKLEQLENKQLLNPGALYRAEPLSFAVVEIGQSLEVKFIEVPK